MLACMFPGQGSHYPGMGKELFSLYPDLCDAAHITLGYPIESLCSGDDPVRLNSTEYTQPAIYFVSCLAYLEKCKEDTFKPDMFLGHSLGLYASLFAAGVFDLATGLRIVAQRGRQMAAVSGGAMMAVLGDNVSQLPTILLEHDFHDVDIANFNSPRQVVISGKSDRVVSIGKVLEQVGFHCARLPVSGPFHSRYMDPARLKFVDALQHETLSKPTAHVISTTSARRIGGTHLLEELGFQLTKPVRWMQTVRALVARHPGICFQEVGPGQVLTRLNAQLIPTH